MDYERDNYLRATTTNLDANMQQQQQQHQQQQQQELQHKMQLQQQQQQQQLEQRQQQQQQHLHMPADYHQLHQQHLQQQMHQHHLYMQQQHQIEQNNQHHAQQQQQLQHNTHLQQQHHQQQMLLHQQEMLRMHVEQQQQQQQQHLNPAITTTLTPNYVNANPIKTTAAATTTTIPTTVTTTLATMQQQQQQLTQDANNHTTATEATTTTNTPTDVKTIQRTQATAISLQNDMHYAAMQQQQQQQQQQHQPLQQQYAATNNNNKTDSTISAFANNTNNNNNNNNHNNNNRSITNNLENGINNAQMDYNKYYQQYMTASSSTTTTETPVTTTHTTAAATSNASNSYMLDTTANTTLTPTTINESDQTSNDSLKRKHENEMDLDTPDAKKALEDKKNLIVNMRKNIRDVMDETQLDTNTLAAQREESERLARVAEQQKAMREYQRQTAVNRQFVRTQNRVMSLLQSGKTYAKFTEEPQTLQLADNVKKEPELKPSIAHEKEPIDTAIDEEEQSKSSQSSKTESEQPTTADVVTIEDSSSEDDCILLSDDDDEELMDEEVEDDPHNSGLHVQDSYNVPDELGRVVINVGHPEGEEDIYVAPQIAKTIKPHQIGGVRFLFDNIIESTKRFKYSSGFGCILAHSMGLGKTLQVVCFCDIFLRHTNSKTVLCVMPINTLQNWVNEFNMWTPRQSPDPTVVRPRHFDVFVLNDQHKTLSARAKVILRWAEQGGVLLIGYELFRLLAMKIIPQRKRRGQKQFVAENTSSESHKRLTESIYQALVKPGPDLVICDEGHRIKNAHAGISMALKQIRTRRRIVLTGYPLQNNLLEYWCMVDFVRPNYLGNRTEFCNMFERPIQNGQCIDSTPEDIKLMRYRAHVLHSLLVGFVQRRSHMVLQQTLPQKLEYVILTRMTTFQRQLYDIFMNDVVRTRTVPNPLKAFSVCCKIWNHPDVLYNFLKRYEHDLDIEIEDSEIVPDTPATPTTIASLPATTVNCNSSQHSAIETTEGGATPSSVVSATLVDESQTSSSGFSSMTAATPTPTLPASEQNSTTKTASAEVYDNMQFSTHSGANAGISADCNGNNYWLEPNLPYYTPYQQVMPSQHTVQQPDYIGIVKPRPGAAGEHTSSSEIVDLDTKEIKTVETDLDLERNTLIKTDSITSTKANKTTTANAKSQNKQLSEDKTSDETIKHTERDTSRWADGVPYDWALDLMKKYEPDLIENSPKMEVFFCILHQSIKLNDRVLLFSQSLLTLNLIERFLQANYVPGTETYWARNISYFRLDGSTNSQEREKLVNEFNTNHNVKLFLISTRAGSLGINLVGANRVVVFDASWNPCHDTQAVYRIYRYGQQKACYVYRIVMDRCLEKKIYDRQIKKQGMSDRVVDECNPDAHLSLKDVTNLCHDYDDDNKAQIDAENFKTPIANYVDDVIKKVILNYKGCLSKEPFFHESLLIDRKEKKLSQAEKRQAHRGYEMEKKASIRQTINHTATNKIQYRIIRNDGVSVTRPVTTQNTRNTNIRTTRWIPAEVWQRQGMTAQEMTLPLDVVIPTNSSDKSNIILKAGQRVMVLKSAKGIYMQLDSGKIIAIRTSSKAADGASTSKAAETKSNEVIDITADGDNASNQTASSNSSSTSNSNTSATSTTISNTAINTDPKLDSNYNSNNNSILSSSSSVNAAVKINKPTTTHLTTKDAKHKTDAFINNGMTAKYDALNKNNNSQKSKEITTAFSQQHHATLNSAAAATTTNKKPVQKIEITANERLPPIKPFSSSMYNSTAITTTHNNMTDSIYDNEQKYNNRKPQVIQQQQQQQSNDKLSNPQQQQHKHKMQQQNSAYVNSNHQQTTKSTTYVDYEQQHDIYGNKTHQSVHNEPRQTDKVDNTHYMTAYAQQQQQQQQLSPTNTRTNDVSNNNHNTTYAHTTETTIAASNKNKIKTAATECFQNANMYTTKTHNAENDANQSKAAVEATTTSCTTTTHTPTQPAATSSATQHMIAGNGTYGKLSSEILPTYAQYTTPVAQQQQVAATPTPTPQQQQQLAQQQQQAAKMRLYMPQFSMPHSNYTTQPTVPAPPTSIATSAAPPTSTVLPSTYAKTMPNYSQYYESMYDCSNNMPAVEYTAPPPPHPAPPTAAGYPDYTAAYHHAPYHTNFQPNTYGCATLTAPVRGPPYMHWSPLVTSASLAEHHAAANSIFSTANYANDAAAAAAAAAAQANQWHHQ